MNEHRWAMDNLSWYTNGTLVGSELERVQRHLGECLVCQQEWRAEQRIASAVAAEALLPTADDAFAKLSERLDRQAQRGRSWRARLRELIDTTPAPARVAVVFQALLLALVLSVLVLQRPGMSSSDEFRTRSDVLESGDLRVLFDPELSDRQIDDFVQRHAASIVAGPTQRGVYTLSFPAPISDTELVRIRASGSIVFADRPAGGAAAGP